MNKYPKTQKQEANTAEDLLQKRIESDILQGDDLLSKSMSVMASVADVAVTYTAADIASSAVLVSTINSYISNISIPKYFILETLKSEVLKEAYASDILLQYLLTLDRCFIPIISSKLGLTKTEYVEAIVKAILPDREFDSELSVLPDKIYLELKSDAAQIKELVHANPILLTVYLLILSFPFTGMAIYSSN